MEERKILKLKKRIKLEAKRIVDVTNKFDMHFKIAPMQWPPNNSTKITATLEKIPGDSLELLNKTGKLTLNQPADATVAGVYLIGDNEKITKIPHNLLDYFPNMTSLSLSGAIKSICRNDLKFYKNLKTIEIIKTEIEELPADIFADNSELEVISVHGNLIKYIGKGIFNNLKKLKFIDLHDNLSIDLMFAENCGDLNSIIEQIYPTRAFYEMQKIFECNDFKDFTIKVGDEEFKSHKLMLAARSPKLAETIKNNPDADELILEDIEVEVFKIILDFIYMDKVPENLDENSEKVFVAAGKLKLEELKLKVGDKLCDAVNAGNFLDFQKLALKHGHEDLKRKSFEEFKKKFPGKQFKEDLMDDPEKLEKMIEAKKVYDEKLKEAEEKMKKIQNDFENIFKDE